MTRPVEQPVVLYVDDDALNLRVLEASVAGRVPLVTCGSPAEALALLEREGERVGVVLSDQRMPGMTGVELLERARTLVPDARRMLVTAYADLQVVVDAVNRGQVARYFVKPWERVELLTALEEALRAVQTEARLREVEGRLLRAERLAVLGQVAAGVAHELGGPLAYLAQNTQALERDLPLLVDALHSVHLHRGPGSPLEALAEELPGLVGDLSRGVTHLREVSEGLKAQARGDAPAACSDVSEVAHWVARLARPALRERARLRLDGPSARVALGPVAACQVLLNLVVNAAHACEGSGRPGEVAVRWRVADGRVVVAVEDNGRGVPPDVQARLAQGAGFTTKAQGTGLGLAICRELVERAGGALQLSSREGQGTCVELLLPAAG